MLSYLIPEHGINLLSTLSMFFLEFCFLCFFASFHCILSLQLHAAYAGRFVHMSLLLISPLTSTSHMLHMLNLILKSVLDFLAGLTGPLTVERPVQARWEVDLVKAIQELKPLRMGSWSNQR